jgi:hypothetical protein
MKSKRAFFGLVLLVAVLGGLSLHSQSAYDRDQVVKVMRQNQALLGQIRSAIGKADYFGAAQGFWKFAEGMESIRAMTPPKGSAAAWDSTLGEFVFTALRGVGAAGEKDGAKATAALQALQALNQKGHAAFK